MLSLSALLERRVPHALAFYAGAAATTVTFTGFLVDRYALSPYLVDALLVTLLLAVPAVVTVAWALHDPAPVRWTRRRGATLSCNAVLALAVVGVGFWGKPLGSTVETVRAEGADGEVVERTAAREAFRKRVAVAYLDGEPELARALTAALQVDLGQNLYLTVSGPRTLRRSLRAAGFEDGTGAPLPLLRSAAAEVNKDFLITGRAERDGARYRLALTVHELGRGGRSHTISAEGGDPFAVVDEVSAQALRAFGLPGGAHAEDLPVADLLTGSFPALQAYAAGAHALSFGSDTAVGLALLDEAVALDSTFALAQLSRGDLLQSLSRLPLAHVAFTAAQRHSYRLLGPHRFAIAGWMAQHDGRMDDALRALEQWTALYPDDARGFASLGRALRALQRDPEAVVAAYQRAVRLDPGSPEAQRTLATVLVEYGRLDEALAEAQAYVAAYPTETGGLALLALVHARRGDLDLATDAIRQGLALDPRDASLSRALGAYLQMGGAWDEAASVYERSLAQSVEPWERVSALSSLAHYHEARGEYARMIRQLDAMWEVYAGYAPPTQVLAYRLGEAYHYARAGHLDWVDRVVAEAEARDEHRDDLNYQISVALRASWAYARTGRSGLSLRYADRADSLAARHGLSESAVPTLALYRGFAYAEAGDWRRAAEALGEGMRANPTYTLGQAKLAEVYLALGDTRRAREEAEAVVAYYPAHPESRVVLARLPGQRPAQAREHLEVALQAWAHADPGFRPAQEARDLLARLPAR